MMGGLAPSKALGGGLLILFLVPNFLSTAAASESEAMTMT